MSRLPVRIGVVTGLAIEAACFDVLPAAHRPMLCCNGPGTEAARRAARALVGAGCAALASVGFAGGLRPEIAAGDVIVVTAAIAPWGEEIATDLVWRERLLARLSRVGRPTPLTGAVAGADQPVLTPDDKQALARKSGAWIVDMESHAVGQVAAEAGLPFVALRAVCDAAGRRLPRWITQTVDDRGHVRVGRVAAGVFGQPRDLPTLAALARDQRAALAALRRSALDAGPLLAFS